MIFLILGTADTVGINWIFGAREKEIDINFRDAKTEFCWVCIIVVIIFIYL